MTISQKDPQIASCLAHSDIKATAVGEATGNLSSRQCKFAGQKVHLELEACVFGF